MRKTQLKIGGRTSNGFTLLELMIVVGIVGILASIAIPIYQGYTIRTRVSEAILFLSQCRASVSEIYQFSEAGATRGADNWDCGENETKSQYVSNVNTTADGWVIVTLKNIDPKVNTSTLAMIPLSDTNQVAVGMIPTHVNGFECLPGGGNPVDINYVPRGCR